MKAQGHRRHRAPVSVGISCGLLPRQATRWTGSGGQGTSEVARTPFFHWCHFCLHQATVQFPAEATHGDALEYALQMTRPGLCPKVGFGCRKLRGCLDVYRGSARLELLDSVGKHEWLRRANSEKGPRAGRFFLVEAVQTLMVAVPVSMCCRADPAPAIVACLGLYCFCRCRLTASILVPSQLWTS